MHSSAAHSRGLTPDSTWFIPHKQEGKEGKNWERSICFLSELDGSLGLSYMSARATTSRLLEPLIGLRGKARMDTT